MGSLPESHTAPLQLAIVGGGIGGLALMLSVLHNDPESKRVRPHLYESAPAFSEIGAGIGFGPNSVEAMRLCDPRLREAYDEIAVDAEVAEGQGPNGETKYVWNHFYMGMDGRPPGNKLKAGDQLCSVYNFNRRKNIHRARLLEAMVDLLPNDGKETYVSFKKRVIEVVETSHGVELHFADDSSSTAEAVIGCDGVKSRIRQVLLKGETAVEPRFTGKYAYRGLVPMEEAIKAIGDQARCSHMVHGYGGHLVNFPIDQGRTLNIVAFQTKKEWEHGQDWVIPATKEDVNRDFAGWGEPIRNLLSMLRKPEKWGLFEHPPASTYHRAGRICLLGDCAHASSPHQGAGAGMAIEDAAVLGAVLGNVDPRDPAALEKAFSVYDEVRRPRSQRLVTSSRDCGILWDFQKEGVLDDPEIFRQNAEERMKWIWDFDLASSCSSTVASLKQK